MCGCSNFVNNDEKEFITQDESNREFDFTGNRPSIIDFGNEDSFDFTGNRPSIIEVGEDPTFDFGGNRQAKKDLRAQGLSRKEARKVVKGKMQNPLLKNQSANDPNVELDPETGLPKTTYGQGDWFGRNWIWIVAGIAVLGGGYYIYKKRK